MEFARVSPTQAHLLHEARLRPFPTNFCRKSQDKAIRGRVVGGRWQIKMPAPPPSPLWQTMEQARVTAMATNPYLPTLVVRLLLFVPSWFWVVPITQMVPSTA